MFFDRLIAAFQYTGTVGFIMYAWLIRLATLVVVCRCCCSKVNSASLTLSWVQIFLSGSVISFQQRLARC